VSLILGDADNEPALNGWKDTDGRLPIPSKPRIEGRVDDPWRMGRECGGSGSTLAGTDPGGELVSEPIGLTAFNADIGLVPIAPAP
jgi:hypothetical protein